MSGRTILRLAGYNRQAICLRFLRAGNPAVDSMTRYGYALCRLRPVSWPSIGGSNVGFGKMLRALAAVAITTVALLGASSVLRLEHVSIVYLVPVLISAAWWGAVPAVLSAAAGVAASAFFFYPPIYDLRVSNSQQIVDLCLFICVAMVTSHLTERIRTHAGAIEKREGEMRSLYAFSRRLAAASTAREIRSAVRDHVSLVVGRRVVLFEPATETGAPTPAADVHGVPEVVQRAVSQCPQDDVGTTCIDDRTGSAWLVRAVSAKNAALGKLAVEIGRNPAAALESIGQRTSEALTEAAATLERLDLARALEEANLRADRDAFREALIGSVSHELRTPLSAILGAASVLAQTPTVARDARMAELTAVIREEAERLNSDIQNLLDASRISSQGVRARCVWSDPADLINTAVERYRRLPSEPRLDIRLPDDLPLVSVDPVLVEQALRQIIDNAVKYSPAASTVTIAAHRNGSGCVVLSVTDQGAGLTEEDQSRLFERFYRGARHQGTIPGSGLGLSIARAFVAASGGQLSVESRGAGHGTTVSIHLAASRLAAGQMEDSHG